MSELTEVIVQNPPAIIEEIVTDGDIVQVVNAVTEEIIDIISDNVIIRTLGIPSYYTHTQSTPSDIWIVNHNLGYRPGGIMVIDSSDREVIGSVNYININTLTISFVGGFSGTAYIS